MPPDLKIDSKPCLKVKGKWFKSGKLLLVTPSHSLSTKLPHLTGENLSNCRGRFKVTSWLKPNNPTLSPKKLQIHIFLKISHGMKIVTCDEISYVKCQLHIVLSLHHWSYSGLLQEYQPFVGNSWLHGGWHLSWKVDAPSWQLGPQPPKENHKMVSQSTLIVYAKLTKLTRHNKHSSHLSFSGQHVFLVPHEFVSSILRYKTGMFGVSLFSIFRVAEDKRVQTIWCSAV